MRRAQDKRPAQRLAEYLGKLYNYMNGPGQVPRCKVDEQKLMEDVLECIRGQQKNPPKYLRAIQEILRDVDYTVVSSRAEKQSRPQRHDEVLRQILVCVAYHWGLSQRRSRVA